MFLLFPAIPPYQSPIQQRLWVPESSHFPKQDAIKKYVKPNCITISSNLRLFMHTREVTGNYVTRLYSCDATKLKRLQKEKKKKKKNYMWISREWRREICWSLQKMNSCLLVLLCPSSVVMETPLKRREIPADSPTEEMRKYEDQIATQLCYAERANNERDERNSCIFSHSRKKIRLIFTSFKNFDCT